jgi:hypothetical protein
MKKLFMLAGGIVEPGAGKPGAVSAFVAFNPSPTVSRLFKLEGPTDAPRVSELPAATTVDLSRFRRQVEEELEPVVRQIVALGGPASISAPRAEWVNQIVQAHLDAER